MAIPSGPVRVRVRRAGAQAHARPGTPRAAVAAGATHIVVGRTITSAADPVAALRLVRTDMEP
jgi:orotidine-5'-phosphate decarboxylase